MPPSPFDSSDEIAIPGSPSECSYLPGQTACMEYRIARSLTTARYEHLLERGWRRFGTTLFRPKCPSCRECVGLRINITDFKATKSQRRAFNKCDDLTLHVNAPSVTQEHIDLYNLYHQDMHQRRNWRLNETTVSDYFQSFVAGHFPFSREFQYRRNGKLVALGNVDVTGNVMSSIYFIHHPEIRDESPGTVSVLRELEFGRQTGHKWLYMGYYIRDCGSMNYKNRFRPHQLLKEFVPDEALSPWQDESATDD